MAIATDAAILFFGTQDEVTVASPSAVDGDTGISTPSDINAWTNDDDAGKVSFVLNATFAAVPDTGKVHIYCTLNDIQSTNDEPTKDATFPGHYLCSAEPDEVIASQFLAFGPVSLPVVGASQSYQFYIVNDQGDTAHDISAGWSLWVTPVADGPHA